MLLEKRSIAAIDLGATLVQPCVDQHPRPSDLPEQILQEVSVRSWPGIKTELRLPPGTGLELPGHHIVDLRYQTFPFSRKLRLVISRRC